MTPFKTTTGREVCFHKLREESIRRAVLAVHNHTGELMACKPMLPLIPKLIEEQQILIEEILSLKETSPEQPPEVL